MKKFLKKFCKSGINRKKRQKQAKKAASGHLAPLAENCYPA